FTLVGQCVSQGSGKYSADTVLHSSVDGAMATDSNGGLAPPYVFSNSNTELPILSQWNLVQPPPTIVDTQMSSVASFSAITPTNDLYINGQVSDIITHGLTTPVCTYAGSIQTATP